MNFVPVIINIMEVDTKKEVANSTWELEVVRNSWKKGYVCVFVCVCVLVYMWVNGDKTGERKGRKRRTLLIKQSHL